MQYMYCHLHATENRGCSSSFVAEGFHDEIHPANCLLCAVVDGEPPRRLAVRHVLPERRYGRRVPTLLQLRRGVSPLPMVQVQSVRLLHADL